MHLSAMGTLNYIRYFGNCYWQLALPLLTVYFLMFGDKGGTQKTS
jgi:hypothetical protein